MVEQPSRSSSMLSEIGKIGGLGEIRLIAILVAVTLAVGVVGILAVPFVSAQDRSGDLVESYTATLHPDGRLDETYVYTLRSSTTRMLFRFWEEDLVYGSQFEGYITLPAIGQLTVVARVKKISIQCTLRFSHLPNSQCSSHPAQG